MKFLFDTEKGSYLDEPTKHYILKKGNVPAWILFKNARFSETINYYGLSKPFIKNEVVHLLLPSSYISLNTQKELLKKSLHLVRKFRNVIAHNLKFITYRTDDEYNFNKIPSECIKGFFPDEFLLWKEVREKTRGIDDPYAMFNSLFVLLGDSYLQGKFMDEIESLIQTISSKQPTDVHAALVKTYLETINFPPDIIDRFNAYRARETKEYSQ